MSLQSEDLVSLLEDRLYTKEELLDLVFRVHPEYSFNSCQWVIGSLLKNNVIYSLGYGFYRLCHNRFAPFPSEMPGVKIAKLMDGSFGNAKKAMFHTSLIERLSGKSLDRKATIIEVEKDQAFGVYYELHDKLSQRMMLDPNGKEIAMYFEDNAIIIRKLFSKSPCAETGFITVEKLIVDLIADPLFGWLYPLEDWDDLVASLIQNYDFKISTVMNYSLRRKCAELIASLIKKHLPEDMKKIKESI